MMTSENGDFFATDDRAKSVLSSSPLPLRKRKKGGNDVDGVIDKELAKRPGLLMIPPRIYYGLRKMISLEFGIKSISVIVVSLVALATFNSHLFGLGTTSSDKLQPPPLISAVSSPPTFLKEAIDSCEAAKNEHGEYPFMSGKIIAKRTVRWTKEQHKYNFLRMIDDKLGGYMYATKHGIRTPRILFCGKAKDVPQSMSLFGNNYVIKPLTGHSAQGVKVIRYGVDTMKKKRVNYDILTKAYDKNEKEIIVEELIESANPKYAGLIPPDYKFFVYGGGKSELLWYIDRNEEPKCSNFFDVSSKNIHWVFLEDIIGVYSRPCPNDTRKAVENMSRQKRKVMEEAVQTLSEGMGPNWMRIDMYDSTHGPVLGEFTPFSSNGHGEPLSKCIMTYLFIAHAEHGARPNDDLDLISESLLNDVNEFKARSRMKNRANTKHPNNSTFDFHPPEAREWLEYDEMTKCKKVMAAQQLERDSPK